MGDRKPRKDIIDRTGEKVLMKNGQIAEIISYRTARSIDIKFEDGYIKKDIQYSHFKRGVTTNPYYRSVYGVGYLGNTDTKDEKYKTKKSYKVWSHMLERCYDPKCKSYNVYGGNGVKVSECFKCYEYFERWYNNNYYEIKGETIELDKDILIKNNKIYSPCTCLLVPKKINCLFRGYKKDNYLPRGVSYVKSSKMYKAQICLLNGTDKPLGNYKTIKEAEESYNKARRELILEVADMYKDKIPQKLYDRLIEISNN